jgi:hypothetical protein
MAPNEKLCGTSNKREKVELPDQLLFDPGNHVGKYGKVPDRLVQDGSLSQKQIHTLFPVLFAEPEFSRLVCQMLPHYAISL